MGIGSAFGPPARVNAGGSKSMRESIDVVRGQVFQLAQRVALVKRVRH
jgi:hypothetical protein